MFVSRKKLITLLRTPLRELLHLVIIGTIQYGDGNKYADPQGTTGVFPAMPPPGR